VVHKAVDKRWSSTVKQGNGGGQVPRVRFGCSAIAWWPQTVHSAPQTGLVCSLNDRIRQEIPFPFDLQQSLAHIAWQTASVRFNQ
jgi:hypothetical protein